MSSTAGRARRLAQDSYPLLEPARVDLPLLFHGERLIDGESFLAEVDRIACRLPDRRHVVNLCRDRCRFLLGFAASLSRGQTTLLPPNRTEAALRAVQAEYPDSYVLCDLDTSVVDGTSVRLDPPRFAAARSPTNPLVPATHLAAVAFTSGSTGSSQACHKTWGLFCRSVDLIAAHLGVRGAMPHYAVATVPPQHMYGLETTILLALRAPVVLTDRQAFFPADVQRALAGLPTPRMLVTAPLHLRACLDDSEAPAPVALIVSATAPLSQQMAARAEDRFGGRLLEIFGFSEAGSVAVRRTARSGDWVLFDGLRLTTRGDEHVLSAPYLPEDVVLQDRIELLDPQRFRLLGRKADQVNVAGKRTSIAALNAALLAIEGVRDGTFFLPEGAETTGGVGRLAAFVVAPGLTSAELQAALRKCIDPAFLPRPLYVVDSLPRSENGKLARADLERLMRACRQGSGLLPAR